MKNNNIKKNNFVEVSYCYPASNNNIKKNDWCLYDNTMSIAQNNLLFCATLAKITVGENISTFEEIY